ncbi:hypothetical protein BS47DRAFT_1363934 [Hydnum rufescens UP504]|uniref:Uncharacterized protein n=1 Tax=Hydnum rufescens UP504 TaxID=1448309 RepID=A0A9P6AUZ3_9AGAM|nr:hypothetical protein BS47DRAFT_1363934 [Hydnum rufescens UP504]
MKTTKVSKVSEGIISILAVGKVKLTEKLILSHARGTTKDGAMGIRVPEDSMTINRASQNDQRGCIIQHSSMALIKRGSRALGTEWESSLTPLTEVISVVYVRPVGIIQGLDSATSRIHNLGEPGTQFSLIKAKTGMGGILEGRKESTDMGMNTKLGQDNVQDLVVGIGHTMWECSLERHQVQLLVLRTVCENLPEQWHIPITWIDGISKMICVKEAVSSGGNGGLEEGMGIN